MIVNRIVAAIAAFGIVAVGLSIHDASAQQGVCGTTKKAAGTPAPKTPKRYTIEQFLATTNYNGASFSADEKRILFNSNETGIFNAYNMPITGGKALALTNSTTDTTLAVGYFPDDDRILYTRDKSGDENNQLYVRELNGTEKDLTPGEKLKATFFGWKPDGTAFYVTSNERDAKFFDIYRHDAKTYARTLFYKNEQGLTPSAISRDEKWIAFGKTNTTLDSDIHLYDVVKGELKHITPHQGSVSFNAQEFAPASKKLFLLSDQGSEFSRVQSYDLAIGQFSEHEKADWDIAFTYFSRDGRFRVTGVNQDGSVVIRIV